MPKYDVALLTDSRFTVEQPPSQYADNVILEDELLQQALVNKGLRVFKTHWDNQKVDWHDVKYAIIRTTWDIYDDGKFEKFQSWLDQVKQKTQLINNPETIQWNIDKHYLQDLAKKGIKIPPTLFIQKGDPRSLHDVMASTHWVNPILKPAVSGGGRHTYKLDDGNIDQVASTFEALIQNESMLLQEFQHNVVKKGELTLMVFGGKYSHAVLKKAKPGDFRVQDDFGGTVHDYEPSPAEIAFAESVVAACDPLPLQARVDFIWDNDNELCVSELELIEPELWFRNKEGSADLLAQVIVEQCDFDSVA